MSDEDDMSFDITAALDDVSLDNQKSLKTEAKALSAVDNEQDSLPSTKDTRNDDEPDGDVASSHDRNDNANAGFTKNGTRDQEQKPEVDDTSIPLSDSIHPPKSNMMRSSSFDEEENDPESGPIEDGDLSRPSWSFQPKNAAVASRVEREQDGNDDDVDDDDVTDHVGYSAFTSREEVEEDYNEVNTFHEEDVTFDSVQLDQDHDQSQRDVRDTSISIIPASPQDQSDRPSQQDEILVEEDHQQQVDSPHSPTRSASVASSTPATTTAATSKIDLDDSSNSLSSATNEKPSSDSIVRDSMDQASFASPTSLTSSKSKSSLVGVPISIDENGQIDESSLATSGSTASNSPSKSKTSGGAQGGKKLLGTRVPNVMQKVMSMTRQRDLPPKDKLEEEKHLRELDEMRAAAKEAEQRRRSQLQAAANARTSRIAAAHSTWESQVLPNWRIVMTESTEGRDLRQLWWDGTMPLRWRGRLWGLCIGNGLAVSKNAFPSLLERARRGFADGSFPQEVMQELEEGVHGTLRNLKLFQRGGAMHEDLVDVLLGYVVYVSKETGKRPRYPPGLACPAAMLLVNMPIVDAFVSLVNLTHKSFLKGFYGDNPDEPDAYYRIFDTLLADNMPRVYENFSKEVVRPSLYLQPWLTTMFVQFLPLDLSTRLFDVFLLEGDSFIFRVALVILQILEPRLFNPVQSELDDVFRGRDRGAVAVVRRERSGSIVLGGGGETEEEVSDVLVEEVYTEMGCTEERIFDLLSRQDWKEETWERLVERELPEAD